MNGGVADSKKTLAITVHGIVQGVGFRPFVYACARRLDVTGWVVNSGQGVEIVASGSSTALKKFIDLLTVNTPPLAQVEKVAVTETNVELPDTGEFVIEQSRAGSNSTLISPDTAICEDCLNDIFSPDNRRFLYPFTNCTNCGPRLTIIHKIPYDRPQTSMAAFTMCPACKQEYDNPADRRFHAQPNACPDCGPALRWHDRTGAAITAENKDCLALCAQALQAGKIVAIKGLGGFHLVVDACNHAAVKRLRSRKNRYGKPLAIMASSLKRAEEIGVIAGAEEELLTAMAGPIVLVSKKNGTRLSKAIAPGISEVGVMLPYTPLHHLLFAQPDCPVFLVMTSGNPSSEPICTTNSDALERLSDIADFFLLHNREIVTRVDDSVVRVVQGRKQFLRRARGYVPLPVQVNGVEENILACGAELKNCFALSRKDTVFLSQHIGDLKGAATMAFFEESVRYMQDVLQITPTRLVCDQHPDYLSTRYGLSGDLPCQQVQHHHAHGAAIMAEHGLDNGLAVIFDGAGFGSDKTVWGGEFLDLHGAEFVRRGHLQTFQLPGGDLAAREIWRIGLSLVQASGFSLDTLPSCVQRLYKTHKISNDKQRAVGQLMEKKINSPFCSSIGRLFDGVASLLNVRQQVEFEGQAAMELESLAWQFCSANPEDTAGRCYQQLIYASDNARVMDFTRLIQQLIDDLAQGKSQAELAFCFHLWLVNATAAMVSQCLENGKDLSKNKTNILLGGGCFQNRILLEMLTDRLEKMGFAVFTAEQVPVNDGGVALGQLYIASRIKCGT